MAILHRAPIFSLMLFVKKKVNNLKGTKTWLNI